jgi:hypothetical protein
LNFRSRGRRYIGRASKHWTETGTGVYRISFNNERRRRRRKRRIRII